MLAGLVAPLVAVLLALLGQAPSGDVETRAAPSATAAPPAPSACDRARIASDATPYREQKELLSGACSVEELEGLLAVPTRTTRVLVGLELLDRAPWRVAALRPLLFDDADGDAIARALCSAAFPAGELPREALVALLEEVARGSSVARSRCLAMGCLAEHRSLADEVRLAAVATPATRACALRAFAEGDAEVGLALLERYRDDADDAVRQSVVAGLAALEDAAALPLLREMAEREAARAPGVAELARRAWLDHPARARRPGVAGSVLPVLGRAVLEALARKDMGTLAALVHPTLGLKMGVYGTVAASPTFLPADVRKLLFDRTVYDFGWDGGEGSVDVRPAVLLDEWLEAPAFLRAGEVGYDTWLVASQGAADSVDWAFPDALFAEYYLTDGTDPKPAAWQSLIVVVSPLETSWRLVGLIHDGWTI